MIAIIGDMIKSKAIPNRRQAQEQLGAVLQKVNQHQEASFASKFTITLGDEFQGVLKDSTGLFRLLDQISFSMLPIQLRFGLGVGNLTTGFDPASSIGADGPAYWKAREAIEYVHKNNDYGRANIQLLAQEPDLTVNLINEILKLTALQVSGWRESQVEVYKLILEEEMVDPDEIDHQLIAEKLGILTSSLSRRFESSGIKRYMSARREAELALERINRRYD
ncbi:MAG: SatD family protein [Anaerolineaceae bacterium]|nr:SatD family protein [Anaerolineaceae bacterium]